MSDPIFTHDTLAAAKGALNGLARRQEVISNNIANVDTPGYKAKQLDFESALKNEIKRSPSLEMASSQAGHLSPTGNPDQLMRILDRAGGTSRADGNNVDIDQELLDMSETSLRFETLTTLLGKKYSLLKEITRR